MNLFQCADTSPATVSAPTLLQTPLGNVRFAVEIHTGKVSEQTPSQTYRLPNGGWLAAWSNSTFDLELLVCRPTFTLPEGMQVTDCWAALWRMRAKNQGDNADDARVGPCLFTAVWESGYTWREGGPNSGEHLYAKTWEEGQISVSIGTQDEEMLAFRAERNDRLPPEWVDYFCPPLQATQANDTCFWQHSSHEILLNSGLPCPLPFLNQGQECQIHFVVAWADSGQLGDWFAVDRQASDILTAANCF